MKYANIIIDISHEKLDRTFQYIIPEHLAGQIEPGMQVMIPFGKGNTCRKGYVLECTDVAEYDVTRLKEIDSISEKQISAEDNAVRLALWLKRHYGSTLITALKTVLPVKKTVQQVVNKTIVSRLSKDEWEKKILFFEQKHQTARLRLAQELAETPVLPYSLVTGKLNISGQTIQAMQKQELIDIVSQNEYRNPVKEQERTAEELVLSEEQASIVRKITASYDRMCMNGAYEETYQGHYLIHGITGSGKTLVYIHLIREMIARGKQAIVLIPEIALTYQTVLRFYRSFGDRVTFVNSKMSAGEKYDQFERARKGEVDVVIGPRSALFVPFQKLGMIVIDEEHENSYKSETMPKYHAREVAFELASYYNASVVLGSATPSLEANYLCEQGQMCKFTLTQRLTGGTLPQVYVEDLREELKKGNRTMYSTRLRELIEDRLQKKEQIILFLNRRGYAGFVSCRTCGTVMKCPHCDVSLSEHRNGSLVCHYCGYTIQKPSVCPTCQSRYLMGFKAGTQQIEENLWREFPHAKTLRMDADTTKNKDSYEEILEAFANREADILIGTQMIVKGHDFPYVTLVGILAADLSLHMSDYRAGERTFELLTQAAGRAGRGDRPGDVVIQTYQPEHMAIRHAAEQDYDGFYAEEIQYRELMNYPPVTHMMSIQVMAEDENTGKELSQTLTSQIRRQFGQNNVIIIGPAPAYVGKVKDVYRFVSYAKCRDYDVLVAIKDALEQAMDSNPVRRTMVYFDFDPVTPI